MTTGERTVFVSGCYDILHAGHVQFFREARALGTKLVVCYASADVLWRHKRRRTSLPDAHKLRVLQSLRMVDEVIMSEGQEIGLDFKEVFLRIRPQVLAVTEDDKYADAKRALCREVGCEYVVLPKTPPDCEPISTTRLVRTIQAPDVVPLRVDLGGGWLDVPKFARPGAFVVNCAIAPMVSLKSWPYRLSSGLGGSAAWAILNGQDGVASELGLGVGWQDPAVIRETGLCAWRSGPMPALEVKSSGDILHGRMALLWTGESHVTPNMVDLDRDFDLIEEAGAAAAQGVREQSRAILAEGVRLSYRMQRNEGMKPLPEIPGALAMKYCGGGWGGYAVYLFDHEEDRARALAAPETVAIEPHLEIRGMHMS